ncbi:MAG: hypothetical protein IH943_04570 [Acidobacteria bacterium]|nr:hypothetical protein [Acidobacteriota bacterium]
MKVGTLLMVFLIACQTASPTPTTTDQCPEARTLWDENQDLQETGQELPDPDGSRAKLHAEIAAILAEQHPDCFTVQERVIAEAARRLLAE